MPYTIECSKCDAKTRVKEITLMSEHTDKDGILRCFGCGNQAYIRKKGKLQEKGEIWTRYIRGFATLVDPEKNTYVPYAEYISETPDGRMSGSQYSYYKDLRPEGGKLKIGHGPGGTPYLTEKVMSKAYKIFKKMKKLLKKK